MMKKARSSKDNTEVELKYSLSKKEFEILKKHLNTFPHKTKLKTNHYFDSCSLILKRNKIGLRIRTSGKSQPILTLKFPKLNTTKTIKSLKVRYEYEEPIAPKQAKLIISKKLSISDLDVLPIGILKRKVPEKALEEIVKLGALKTRRTVYQYAEGLMLELDRFEFFGKTFYELEVETKAPKNADKSLRELFKELKIKYSPEEKSKLSRFLKEWQKIKKA